MNSMNIADYLASIRQNIHRNYHREYIVSLLCCAVVFLFADQNLMSPNLSLIAEEFHFSDTQRDDLLGGKIALGFFVIGGIVSVAAGFLADTVNRIRIFSYIVILGELSCVLTYWTTTYTQLFVCRIFTGISIGGASPIIFSLLADFYPGGSRIKMSTLIGISMGLGTSLGQVLAGFLGPLYGWRLPFILVGAPAIIFAFWILFTGQEPKRGGQEESVRSLKKFDDYCLSGSSNSNNDNGIYHNNSKNNNNVLNIIHQTDRRAFSNSIQRNSLTNNAKILSADGDIINFEKNEGDDTTAYDSLPNSSSSTVNPIVLSSVTATSPSTVVIKSSSSQMLINKPKNGVSYSRLTDDDVDNENIHTNSNNANMIHGREAIATSYLSNNSNNSRNSNNNKNNKPKSTNGITYNRLTNDDGDDNEEKTNISGNNNYHFNGNSNISNDSATVSVTISDKSDTSLIRVIHHTYIKDDNYDNSNGNKRGNVATVAQNGDRNTSNNHTNNKNDNHSHHHNNRSNNNSKSTNNNNSTSIDIIPMQEQQQDNGSHSPHNHSQHHPNNINSHHNEHHRQQPLPQEEIHYSEKIEFHKVLGLFRNKSVLLIFMQGIPGCAPWGMIGTFLNDYFSNDRHMTVMHATFALAMFGFGTLLGQLLGGFFGQYLYNRDKRLQCLLMGISSCLGVFPMLYLVNSPDTGSVLFYFMAVLGGTVVAVTGPNVRAVLQNVCTPETRGTAFSLYNLTDDIGKGVGPAIVVELIRIMGHDRQTAFTIVTWFWMICGILLLCLTFTVLNDEQRVQEHVRSAVLRQSTKKDNQNIQNQNDLNLSIKLLSEQRNPLTSSSQTHQNQGQQKSGQPPKQKKKQQKEYTSLTQDSEICV